MKQCTNNKGVSEEGWGNAIGKLSLEAENYF